MLDLSPIYTTTYEHEGAELRCQEHLDWWSDADGTSVPDVIKAAESHVRDKHRVHVTDCACGDRVIDQQCIPTTAPYRPEARRG